MYQPPENLREGELYQRSSFQVALLLFFTFGLYIFWWSYRVRKSAAALLEEQDAAGWRSIALIVPIVNFFMIFELIERIKISAIRMGMQPPQALAAWALLGLLGFEIVGRIPVPYRALTMLAFIPFAFAHQYLVRAELMATKGNAIPKAFSIVEIFIIVLGVAVRALVMFAYTVDENLRPYANAWFAWVVLLAVIIVLAYFYRQGHQLVQEKFTPA